MNNDVSDYIAEESPILVYITSFINNLHVTY